MVLPGTSVPVPEVIDPWIPGASKLELTYRYNVENLPLIGRDTEIKILKAFCKEEDPFLWYAICGPGGSGKSRLAYEFARMMRTEGWEVFWLKEGEYAILSEATFKTEKPILIIADYVLMHTDAIGKFIGKMNGASTTIRLLLIERADEDLSKSQDMREYPIWNSLRIHSKIRDLLDTLYKNDQREFLFLNPFTDEALLEVIEKYANQIPDRKKTLSTQDTKIILKRLYEVDPKYRRPLYARILVLLWANDEEWENYSVTRLMQKVLDREIDRWKKYLCEDNEYSRECLLELLAIVTMNGGMTAESLKNMYPDICDEMSKYLTKDKGLPAFFEDNEMIDLTSDGDSFFCSVEPDLFGEYLVLNWLSTSIREMKKKLNILFDDKWYENTSKAQFLMRLIGDYEELHKKFPENEEIAWEYAQGLVNQGDREDLAGARSCVAELEELHKKSLEDVLFVLAYASGLVNQSNKEDLAGARSCVAELEELHKKSLEDVLFALAYARGLVAQVAKEDLSGARSCVAKLEELHKKFPENEEIASVYEEGLDILGTKE